MARMQTQDRRVGNPTEELGPAAKVGTSTLKPRDGGGKVVPPKETPPKPAGPPLAFETTGDDGNTAAKVTVTTVHSKPASDDTGPEYAPFDGWCAACSSGLWSYQQTNIACLFDRCPLASSGDAPFPITLEAAFERLYVDGMTAVDALVARLDVDASKIEELINAHTARVALESPSEEVNAALGDAAERFMEDRANEYADAPRCPQCGGDWFGVSSCGPTHATIKERKLRKLEKPSLEGLIQEVASQIAVLPIPMLLWCPGCGARHIDEGEFVTKLHHTHACQTCGMVWRPALVATLGVHFLPGFKQ